MAGQDWNPDLYSSFAGIRLQPAIDLLARVGGLPEGDVIDLGCGNGAVAPVLRQRFPDRRIIGIDTSASMLEEARRTGLYDDLIEADAADWGPRTAPALIYSNAALHWLPDHETLLPRLSRLLAPGGVLAVQMPHQNPAPSHRLWHDLVARHYPGRFDPSTSPGILEASDYHRILSPLGVLSLWETEYFQTLPPSQDMHPVRKFTSATFARPIFAVLDQGEKEDLCARYDAAVETYYPIAEDGSVLFPFRRLFFTLQP